MPDDSLRLAVLIDADNASAAVIGDILSEVASLGTASVKRVYGDFTTSNLHSWRAVLLEHAIQPVQQFVIRSARMPAIARSSHLKGCCHRLCRHSDRARPDLDPSCLDPGHQYLGQPGAQ